MTSDVIVALSLAEHHLEKDEWVQITHDKATRPVVMYVGTIHGNRFKEIAYIRYIIKDGGVDKYTYTS